MAEKITIYVTGHYMIEVTDDDASVAALRDAVRRLLPRLRRHQQRQARATTTPPAASGTGGGADG